MTEIAQVYLGNINHNSDLSLANDYLQVRLNQSDRHKGRIYAQADSGEAIGIIKSRDRPLQTGDIFRTNLGKLLLIHLKQQELLVLDLSQLSANISSAKLVHLGHILGNHHYPITIQGNKIYIQLVTDKPTIEKLIDSLNIADLQVSYQEQKDNQELYFSSHSH